MYADNIIMLGLLSAAVAGSMAGCRMIKLSISLVLLLSSRSTR